MRILFPILTCICVSLCKIVIKDAGVATLSRGDVGMIFYITLQNIASWKYQVHVRMIKCCEKFGESDMDCKLMRLMGGDMGMLYPNVTKNISLLYPNMYLHNRRGQCLISVQSSVENNSSFAVQQQIAFDTVINDTIRNPVLRGYYTKRELTICNSIDEDPLDKCEPINCQMKYLGSRNYFNRKWKRCQKVPICIADPDKDLPDVSYLPISNTCCDLENLISVEDLKRLEKGAVQKYREGYQIPEPSVNLRCHHGKINNETGFCVCDDGWTSAPLDKDQYEPGLSTYHMCNIEIGTWKDVNSTKIKMTAVIIAMLGAMFAVATIMASFVCHVIYRFLKSKTASHSPVDSEAQTHCPTDKDDTTIYSELDPAEEKQLRARLETARRKSSVVGAGKRSSIVFHRKVNDVKQQRGGSDNGLPLFGKTSATTDGNTDTEKTVTTDEGGDDVLHTTSFQAHKTEE